MVIMGGNVNWSTYCFICYCLLWLVGVFVLIHPPKGQVGGSNPLWGTI